MPNNIIEKNIKDINREIDYHLQRKHFIKRDTETYDDLYQSIMLKLVERIKDYNPNKSKITTFTQMICRNTLSKIYRKENTMKNLVYNQSRTIFEDDHVYYGFEEDITTKIFFQQCITTIGNKLSYHHKDIFEDYLNGKRVGDIAIENHILTVDVYDIIDECIQLLKSLYKQEI